MDRAHQWDAVVVSDDTAEDGGLDAVGVHQIGRRGASQRLLQFVEHGELHGTPGHPPGSANWST
nr:hypothetical protein [Nocardiopsis xinjiangensis]